MLVLLLGHAIGLANFSTGQPAMPNLKAKQYIAPDSGIC